MVGAARAKVAWFVEGKDLFRTSDGGATWTAFTPLAGGVLDAAYPTATVGYLLNSQGVLFRTTDGGGRRRALP